MSLDNLEENPLKKIKISSSLSSSNQLDNDKNNNNNIEQINDKHEVKTNDNLKGIRANDKIYLVFGSTDSYKLALLFKNRNKKLIKKIQEENNQLEKEKEKNDNSLSSSSSDSPTSSSSISTSQYFSIQPTFTHQIFEDELINNLTDDEINTIEIIIGINYHNLHHHLLICGNLSTDTIDFIHEKLKNFLPKDYTYGENMLNNYEENNNEISNYFLPPGRNLIEYNKIIEEEDSNHFDRLKDEDNNLNLEDKINEKNFKKRKYELKFYLSQNTDNNSLKLLRRLESIAIWFIETADGIDFNDPQWELLTYYKVPIDEQDDTSSQSNLPIFLGYQTFFSFLNPFSGSHLRICQALVLPLYQGKSYGQALLHLAYDLAESRSSVSSVTVEHPSTGFQILRSLVEFDRCIKRYEIEENDKIIEFNDETYEKIIKKFDLNTNLSSSNDKSLSTIGNSSFFSKLKIIKNQQIYIQYFIEYLNIIQTYSLIEFKKQKTLFNNIKLNKYLLIKYSEELHDIAYESDKFIQFRLKVKKNFLKIIPELKYLNKNELKEELTELFEEKCNHFLAILRYCIKNNLINLF